MIEATSQINSQNKTKKVLPNKQSSSVQRFYLPNLSASQDTYSSHKPKKEKTDIWKAVGAIGIVAAAIGAFAIANTIGMFRRRPVTDAPAQVKAVYEDLSKNLGIGDMALPQKLKDEFQTVKRAITHLSDLKERGAQGTQSILLYGPPGTGKTTFVRALAKDLNANLAILDTTKMSSKYMGETEQNIQALVEAICKDASENPTKKFIVFVDEIDSIMMVDNSTSAKHSNTTLNEFKRCLTERLFKHDNIITIGATNLSATADNSGVLKLLAPGKELDSAMLDRFSTKILVDLPSKEQLAEAISKHYGNCKQVSGELKGGNDKLNKLAEKLEGKVSFRNMNEIYNKAGDLATQSKQPVSLKHFVDAIKSQQEAITNNASKDNLSFNWDAFVKELDKIS